MRGELVDPVNNAALAGVMLTITRQLTAYQRREPSYVSANLSLCF